MGLEKEDAPRAAAAGVTVAPPSMRDQDHSPSVLLAKAYFDNKEFFRAAHVLDQHCGSSLSTFSPHALFLRCYSLYLVRLGDS